VIAVAGSGGRDPAVTTIALDGSGDPAVPAEGSGGSGDGSLKVYMTYSSQRVPANLYRGAI
jgi:hypothetical protein